MEKSIKMWIRKKFLIYVSVLFITIGLALRCRFNIMFYSVLFINLGVILSIVQILHLLIDLEDFNKKFPKLYLLFYASFIYIFAVITPEIITYILNETCS